MTDLGTIHKNLFPTAEELLSLQQLIFIFHLFTMNHGLSSFITNSYIFPLCTSDNHHSSHEKWILSSYNHATDIGIGSSQNIKQNPIFFAPDSNTQCRVMYYLIHCDLYCSNISSIENQRNKTKKVATIGQNQDSKN